jgi:hypothetical protein
MQQKNEGLENKQGAFGLPPGNLDMLVIQRNGVVRRTTIKRKRKYKSK